MASLSLSETHSVTNAPGPRGFPILGVAPWIRRNTLLPFYSRMQKKFGDFVHLPFPGINLYLVSHPDSVKYILQDNASNYVRTILYDRIRPIFGNGLITSEGEQWRRHRRLMQPAFHSKRIAEVAEITAVAVGELSERLTQKAKNRETFNLIPELMHLTLEIASKALFSTGFTPEQKDEIGRSIDVFQEFLEKSFWSLAPIPLSVPTPRNKELLRAKKRFMDCVQKIIQDRRQDRRQDRQQDRRNSDSTEGNQRDDLLSMLMNGHSSPNALPNTLTEAMTDEQIQDEVTTLLVAGHETTANVLSWTYYLLAQHPEVIEKLKTEVSDVLGERTPTLEDLPRLKNIKRVLEESMRMYPPAYFFSRTPLNDDQIGPYKIPKKSVLLLSPWLVHRHPDFWKNPDQFDPERFNPENTGEGSKKSHRFAYFPFGGGPHSCIGASMALMEGQMILASLIQKFEISVLNTDEISPDPLITLRLKPQLKVQVRCREFT